MSSTSFPASAGSASALKELGCEPSPSARSTPIAGPCCESTGQMSLFSETCESLVPTPWPTPRQQDAKHGAASEYELGRESGKDLLHVRIARSMSSAAASPARTFPSPEKAQALKALARDY